MACQATGFTGECIPAIVYYNGKQKRVCTLCGRDM